MIIRLARYNIARSQNNKDLPATVLLNLKIIKTRQKKRLARYNIAKSQNDEDSLDTKLQHLKIISKTCQIIVRLARYNIAQSKKNKTILP